MKYLIPILISVFLLSGCIGDESDTKITTLDTGAFISEYMIEETDPELEGIYFPYRTITYTWDNHTYKSIYYPALEPVLNWIKENTPENSVIFAWWDHGHTIRAYTGRNVVVYSPSKAAMATVASGKWDEKTAGSLSDNKTLQEIAKALTTTDESYLINTMKKHNSEYLFISSELISMYPSLTLIASGTNDTSFMDNYKIYELSDVRHIGENSYALYHIDDEHSVVLNMTSDGTIATSSVYKLYDKTDIDRTFYYKDGDDSLNINFDDNTLDVMIYVYPDYAHITYLDSEQESVMLTQLYYFDGTLLDNLELVYSGEAGDFKVFRLK